MTDEGPCDYDGKTLSSGASKVLMKLLYAARMARYDLLRAVGGLATMVTKWDASCDRRLYRLMCYIQSTLHLRMLSWCGDSKADLGPHLYADADFAGCTKTIRSTSGVFMSIMGPNTSCPLAAMSKKQSAVSHSTPESELVAADLALRTEGIPAIELWGTLLGREPRVIFHEDNQAMIAVCKSGKNPTMRHMGRTHRVSVAWLHERFQTDDFELRYTESSQMAADIFTKEFTDSEKFKQVCSLINHVDPKEFWHTPAADGGIETVSLRCPMRSKQPKASTSDKIEAKRVAFNKRKVSDLPREPSGLDEETDIEWEKHHPLPSRKERFDTDDEGSSTTRVSKTRTWTRHNDGAMHFKNTGKHGPKEE